MNNEEAAIRPRLKNWRYLLLVATVLLTSTVAVADVQYEYYTGSFSSVPDFSSLGSPDDSGTLPKIDLSPATQSTNFAFQFTGTFTVNTAGTYRFRTESDDGSLLHIDGELVVDNDGLHGASTVTGTKFLSVGIHSIEVGYIQGSGSQLLNVTYAPPGNPIIYRPYPASAVLDNSENAAEHGAWGSVIPWPHVPIAAANLPDGRILTWASNERFSFPGSVNNEKTYWGIWDPDTNNVTESLLDDHDMFCSHIVMMEDGKVFVNGGRNSGNTPFTSVFDHQSDTWIPLNDMNRGRWYPTSVALADGSVFTAIGSGGGATPETYRPDTGQWQYQTGINFNPMVLNYSSSQFGERNWWPLLHLAPDGRIFHAGPTPQMHWIDADGLGSATEVGSEFTDWYSKHGTIVMYDEGKLISAGGWVNGTDLTSTDKVMLIDISGAAPDVQIGSPMLNARKFHNGVMLPNGELLVVGGNTSGLKFNDTGSVYLAEIWNPDTGTWRHGAAMSEPRNYHSIALLLPDATVMSAGGGLCNCSADHPDGQIYSPPYLFNPDGTPATRPVISSAPAAIRPGDTFDVEADPGITHFSMIKMSSTTHAVNTDLRYLNLAYTESGGDYSVSAHTNPNVLTPGFWMLFALDAQGTPSEAAIVQVRQLNAGDPTAVASIDITYNNLADLSAFQLNGSATGSGGSLRLTNNTNQSGSGFYRTPILIGAESSFSTRMQFSINGTANGADGLTFTLQGNASTALGNGGDGLGYGGIINSLAVELDTDDDGGSDPDANHIAVNVGGVLNSPLATIDVPFDLEDGNPHTLWLDYDGSLDLLEVFVVDNPTDPKPVSPILSVGGVDLLSLIGSQGYFGFTGGTGTSDNNHDIESWSLAVGAGGEPLVVDPMILQPQPSDGSVGFSASATGTGLEYRWSFGDGSPETAWSSSPDVAHTYAAPGRYVVTLTVRDVNGNEEVIQFTQIVYPPVTTTKPKSSSGLLYETLTATPRVWTANPDNDSVTVINASTNAKVTEIAVGDEPRTLALAPDSRIWVINKDSASISIISTTSLAVVETRQLPSGSEPHGIVFDDFGGVAFVALEAIGHVLKLDATVDTVLASLDVGPNPRHLSLTHNAATLYVSRFITPPQPGEDTLNVSLTGGAEVLQVDPTGSMSIVGTITLAYSNDQAAEQTGPGFPNYLGPAIISPSGQHAWIPSKQDNLPRGTARSGQPLNHEHTVRAVTSVFDIATGIEDVGLRVDHDNASVASNGVFGRYGAVLFVALEGNRQISIIDVFDHVEISRIPVSFAPQAVTISDDGNTLYAHNFLDRSVSVIDISDITSGLSLSFSLVAEIPTVASESLAPDVLKGKQLFYDAADSRLAQQMYMSCASCHNDGDGDGRIWDFTGFGEGLRNTISLKGHAGTGQGRLHWSGNFDEVHDFENQIRSFTLGTGLMALADFLATESTLGPKKAGLSVDLDALAAYVNSLSTFGSSPYRAPGGVLTANGVVGKSVFETSGCANCHTGPGFTDSAIEEELLHDVGTIKASSGQRMGGPLAGIDTPTLKGLWRTAPYLHDGSAQTIREAIEAHDPAVFPSPLSSQELDDLSEYLLQVDDGEVANTKPVLAPIGHQSVVEGGQATIALSATDGDGHNLSFSESGLPAFATLTDNLNGTASIVANPPIGTIGTFTITITATDNGPGGLSDSEAFDLDVTDGVQAPILGPIGDQTVSEGQELTINLTAADLDGDSIVLSESGVPTTFAAFTDNGDGTGQIVANPGIGDAGTYSITITATDDSPGLLSDSEAFNLIVAVNQAPVLSPIGTQTVAEGGSLTISLNATDDDGDDLSLTEFGAPSFATFTDNGNGTGTIVVTPGATDAGTYPVTVTVTDDSPGLLTDNETFDIIVSDVNQPPVLAAIGTKVMNEGGSLNIGLSATDGDGHNLTFGHGGLPAFASFVDNGNGTASINALPSFTDSGTYPITVTVTDDGTGLLSDNETFDLIVNNANQPPDLDPISDQPIVEGNSVTILLNATDGDGDNILLSHSGLPTFASFTDNGDGTGEIVVSPVVGDTGDYPVDIFADDDGSPSQGDSETFTISVAPSGTGVFQQDPSGLLVVEAEHFAGNIPGTQTGLWNVIAEPSASNGEAIKSPLGVITAPPDTSMTEYEANIVTPGDHYIWVRYRAFNGGSDSMFAEVDDQGDQKLTLHFVTGSWEWERFPVPFFLDSGLHVFKLQRREREVEIDKLIVTTDSNYPTPTGEGPPESPVAGGGGNLIPVLDEIGNLSLVEGESLTVNLGATDLDGNNLAFSETGLPPFATLTDFGDGTARIVITPFAGDAGSYPVEVYVEDDGVPSQGDSESFLLTVVSSNSTVFEEDGAGLLVMEAENFSQSVPGTSAGEWTVIVDADASNSGAIKSPDGVITTPPDSAYTEYEANIVVPGDHYIWVRFRSFNSGSDSMFAEVDNLGDQKLTLRPVTTNWEWANFSDPFDLNAGLHVFKIQRRERDVEIDKIVVTTDAGYPTPSGTGPAESPVSGGGGNQAPILGPINDQTLIEGEWITIDVSSTDSDGNSLTLSETGLPAFATLTDNGDGTGQIIVTPVQGDAGSYSIEVSVDDDGVPSRGDTETFVLTVVSSSVSIFQQDGTGLLVMEAENFYQSLPGAVTGEWTIIPEAGASNAGAIKSPLGVITTPPDSAQTEYRANIVLTGDHYIWIRYRSFNSGSDSIFTEVDGLGSQKMTLGQVTGSWVWERFSDPFFLNAGVHDFKIQRRERDVEVDKIVVTTDPAYPLPVGTGPTESLLQ